ncbi:MAG: hypothetical protein NT135_01235 [Candidatus Berkelbacteria bacterium]|nr:hypothetical protein [Candidatus Berkelbacteria bacterium]
MLWNPDLSLDYSGSIPNIPKRRSDDHPPLDSETTITDVLHSHFSGQEFTISELMRVIQSEIADGNSITAKEIRSLCSGLVKAKLMEKRGKGRYFLISLMPQID